MIQKERIKHLGGGTASRGAYVLYRMQASQREDTNHALEYAVEQANARGLRVLVYFGLTAHYPEANLRHYAFMLEGLAEVRRSLEGRGIGMVLRAESPEEAFRRALHLNNTFELDGRDPNGFAGVAWCFGKHDRPWPEQPAFGKVRSMKASGLERKYDMARYIRRVDEACRAIPTGPQTRQEGDKRR